MPLLPNELLPAFADAFHATLASLAADPGFVAAALAAVMVGYFVFGVSGFGSGMFMVAGFAHFVPLSTAIPMALVLDVFMLQMTGRANYADADRAELWRFLPWVLAGSLAGAFLLAGLPRKPAMTALGVAILAYGTWMARNPVMGGALSAWWRPVFAVTGGVMSSVFGAGGPAYSVWYARRLADKTRLRATIASTLTVNTTWRLVVFGFAGLLTDARIWALAVILAPVAWLATKAGRRMHVGLTDAQMRRVVGGLLALNGVTLLARAATS